LGIPDKFIDHGSQEELYDECNFNEKAIVANVKLLLEKQENKALA
jgi:1-deoxy-D-xylulose-5-phosphate synthase